jgi:hypothetical protein
MKPLRIAFAAKQRSGKDCAAEFILQSYPGQVRKFADPLYDLMYMIQDFVGLPRTKDRLLLQLLGTEWGRSHDSNIWLDKLFNTLDLDSNDNIIITDARFMNEFEACKKNGFVLIKIETDDEIRFDRGADVRSHASEVDMDIYKDYDYIITNNGSLDEFYTKLLNILSDITGAGKFIPNCS